MIYKTASILFFCLFTLRFFTPLAEEQIHAAEKGRFFLNLFEEKLPPVVASLPDLEITENDLLTAVLAHAAQNTHPLNSVFRTPESFIPYILQLNEARKNPARLPDQENFRAFITSWNNQRQKASNATGATGVASLAGFPPFGDALRVYLRQQLIEVTGIDPDQPGQFQTSWNGLERKIAASAEGRDYTDREVARYLAFWCDDHELRWILHNLLQRKIILEEARKMEIAVEGLNDAQAWGKICAPLLTTQALTDYFNQRPEKFEVFKFEEWRFPFSDEASKNAAQFQAQAIAAVLKGGENPVLPAGVKRGYVYYADEPGLAQEVSPEAYGLDYIYAPQSPPRSPLEQLPGFLSEVKKDRRPGVVSGPFADRSGWLILRLDCIYQPARRQLLEEFLARKRLNEEKTRLFEAVMKHSRNIFDPASRLSPEKLFHAPAAK